MSWSRLLPITLLLIAFAASTSACAVESADDSGAAMAPTTRLEEPAPPNATGIVAPDPLADAPVRPALLADDSPTSSSADTVGESALGQAENSAPRPDPDAADGGSAPAAGDSEPMAPPRSAIALPVEPTAPVEPPAPVESPEPTEPVAAEAVAPAAAALPPGYVAGEPSTHPLAIERLRGLSYPGSDLVVVQELPPGSTYSRAVATYLSEGLTIRGLLTIPSGERPPSGWPVVIFNHGYIPPAQYRTTERYVAYQDAFARAGYITYKSDYRGHGSSEGESGSSRGTPDYTIDVMNAMASVARHPDADPNRIGMWGHSMGGLITLKSMVISDRIKAGVIWAGVVASYPDLYNRLGREDRPSSGAWNRPGRRSWRVELVELFGSPEDNPSAWAAVSPNDHLDRISGPLQLHHGTADSSVPVIYSTRLQEQMDAAGRPSELFVYEGDDHNLAGSLSTALARSVEFFDRHVKGGG
jgi:dienelactone hydrolase